MPDPGDRTSAQAAFLDRFDGRLAELRRGRRSCPSEPGGWWSRDRGPPVRARPARTGRGDRVAGRPGRRRRGPGRRPGLTIVTSARYDVQPEAHRVRVTLDMTLTNRLSDTSTKRYYFDHAFLAVLPGVSGLKASWSGAGTPRATVSKTTSTHTLVRVDLARRLYSHKTAAVKLVFDLVDAGGAAGRDRPDRLVAGVVPGLGVRHGRDARQQRARRLPRRLQRRGPGRRDPVTEDRRERPDRVPDAQAGQAAVVLRLPRRRQAGELRRADGQRHRRRRAGRPDDPRLGRGHRLVHPGRRARRARAAAPVGADRSALAA